MTDATASRIRPNRRSPTELTFEFDASLVDRLTDGEPAWMSADRRAAYERFVALPIETNQAAKTTPEDVNIVVNKDGEMYWNQKHLANTDELFDFLAKESVKVPQPEVKIRGDQETRYEAIGKVLYTAQRAGIQKVGFITEPPDKG